MSLWNRITYRKPVEKLIHDAENDTRLHRVLGPIGLTSLGVGAIIGAGIFVTTGKAASVDAGPAIMVSYMVAAVACVLAALCYAEFASSVPVAGSAYTYAFATLGEVFAWIIGWDLLLEYAMSCATVASAWTGYLEEFLKALLIDPHAPNAAKWIIPPAFQRDPYTPVSIVDAAGKAVEYPAYFNLPAVAILGALTWVLVRGIKESVVTNTVLVVVKVGVVLFVIAMGAAYVNPANWTQIDYKVGEAAAVAELEKLPPAERAAAADKALDSKWGLMHTLGWNKPLLEANKSSRTNFAPFGWAGIMVGASIVFFAFIGFDSISTHAEEAANPGRDVPFGIIVSLVVCTILYVLVSAVITGMVPYHQIDHHAPIAKAFADVGNDPKTGGPVLRWATVLIAGGGLAGMTSVLLVTFLSQARIFMAMARDGLLPKFFGEVHKTYGTPHWGTLITGAAMCLVAALTPIEALAEMVNIGTLFAFAVVCAAVLILRIKHPEIKRPFTCPFIYVVAPLGIAVNVTLMLFLPRHSWERLAIWMVLGLVLYFVGLKFRRDPSLETPTDAAPTPDAKPA